MRWLSTYDLPPEQRELWAASRVWAAHQVPYLASALLALDPVVIDQSGDPEEGRSDLSRFPTDTRWRVYLDPEVLAVSDVPTVGFWLVHQVAHLLRDHAARYPGPPVAEGRRTSEQQRWNLAVDAEVDDDLVGGELVVPETATTPTSLGQPDGLLAEQYLSLIHI